MINFDGRVAIVTGAGAGLGRSHAIALAERGASVVVNDRGANLDGTGGSAMAAETVVAEIEASGGRAMANCADVADFDAVCSLVSETMDRWGRVDILVNNAGILRDRSFQKMELSDFRRVVEVHLMGSVVCTKAVWGVMREQSYGRVVMTSSSSGMWGNFGQANYAAAKMGLVGLMNSLAIEGQKYDIRVNTLVPSATTRMTANLERDVPPEALAPEAVSPGLLALVHEDSPTKAILAAGAGSFALVTVEETRGIHLSPSELTVETVVTRWNELADGIGRRPFASGGDQTQSFVAPGGARHPD